MGERTSRGYMVQSTNLYIERSYDEATRKQILDRLDPRILRLMQTVNPVAWYPVEDVGQIFAAIAAQHQATDGKVRPALENVGRTIADMATSTFLKLVLRVLTPAMFASKMPDFWGRDNRCGELRAIEFEPAKRRLIAALDGVAGYDFIGPVAPGFILYALERLGHKNVRVNYEWTMDNPGPSRITYDITWD